MPRSVLAQPSVTVTRVRLPVLVSFIGRGSIHSATPSARIALTSAPSQATPICSWAYCHAAVSRSAKAIPRVSTRCPVPPLADAPRVNPAGRWARIQATAASRDIETRQNRALSINDDVEGTPTAGSFNAAGGVAISTAPAGSCTSASSRAASASARLLLPAALTGVARAGSVVRVDREDPGPAGDDAHAPHTRPAAITAATTTAPVTC